MKEIDGDIVVLVSGQAYQRIDLLCDFDFLIERKLDCFFRAFEFRLGRLDCGNNDPSAGIDYIFHEAQGVPLFLFGLFQKMAGELGKRFRGEVGADGEVLNRSAEFVTDLLVDGIDDFLGC